MNDDFAEAVQELETKVDRIVADVKHTYDLTGKEIAAELRRIADGWADEE